LNNESDIKSNTQNDFFQRSHTIYSDKTYPAILNGILSGNLTLIGTAHFKDIANNEYEIDMKAIRTNNAFDVRYIYLGGYFETLEKQFNMKPLPGMLPAK
jgi:hypothetical protein